MARTKSDHIQKLVPKGMKLHSQSTVQVDGGAYHILGLTGHHSGGRELVWEAKGERPTVVQKGTSLYPLSEAIPAKHRRAILSWAARDVLASTPSFSTTHKALWADLHPQLRNAVMSEIRTASDGLPDDLNARVYASALACVGTLVSRDVPDTDNGNLACAWAVNEVVRRATGQTISKELLSTDSIYDALTGGKRGVPVAEEDAVPGTIVISPTEKSHGHVGIMGKDGKIYSNSSKDGVFEQNYNLTSWHARYSDKLGLKVLFFNLNPAAF